MAFKPKRIEEPGEGGAASAASVEQGARSRACADCGDPDFDGSATSCPNDPQPARSPSGRSASSSQTGATVPVKAVATPVSFAALDKPAAEPVLMMSFKASKPFAKMLAEAAEGEGGLRRLVARVFHEAGYPVPPSELQPQRRRRTYD